MVDECRRAVCVKCGVTPGLFTRVCWWTLFLLPACMSVLILARHFFS